MRHHKPGHGDAHDMRARNTGGIEHGNSVLGDRADGVVVPAVARQARVAGIPPQHREPAGEQRGAELCGKEISRVATSGDEERRRAGALVLPPKRHPIGSRQDHLPSMTAPSRPIPDRREATAGGLSNLREVGLRNLRLQARVLLRVLLRARENRLDLPRWLVRRPMLALAIGAGEASEAFERPRGLQPEVARPSSSGLARRL